MPQKHLHVGEHAVHCLHTGATTLPDMPPALDRGTPFVLVHGAGRNAGDFRRALAALGERHSAVALDLPGHGRSTGLDALASVEAYGAVVDGVARTLGLRRAVLVGWSMGALVALATAARGAEWLAGIVVLAVPPVWPPAMLEQLHDVVRGRRPQIFDKTLFSPATALDVMREAWMEQVKTDPRVLYGDLVAASAFDPRPLLESVLVPVLVVHGADDQLTPLARAEEFARGFAGARLEVVEQAGHIPQLEQPARIHALLAAFAEGLA